METKKQQAIKIATERVGKVAAASAWQKLCEGHLGTKADPASEAAFDDTSEADMRGYGIPPAIAKAWAPLFATAPAGQAGEKKARRFRPGRTYSAEEYATYYAADPSTEGLVATIAAATDGKPWLIAPDGKCRVEQSAKYIQWHMDGDIAPATIDVDGAPVAPVMPGTEKAPRLYYVDPQTPGGFLDVEMASPRTGASFKGYSDEALSAYQYLYTRKLQQEGALALQAHADANRGKSAAEILSKFPTELAGWNKLTPEQRPAVKREKSRPFVEPTAPPVRRGGFEAGIGRKPSMCFLGTSHCASVWDALKKHLTPYGGGIHVCSDSDPQAGQNTLEVIDNSVNGADLVVYLVTPDLLASERFRQYANVAKPRVPLVVRACAWEMTPIGKCSPLPVSGSLSSYSDRDEALAEIAKVLVARAQSAASAPRGEPAWLTMHSDNRNTDLGFAKFRKACEQAYDSPRAAKSVLQDIGASPGKVNLEQPIEWIWRDVFDYLGRAGKLRLLYEKARADDSVRAMFAEWR